MGANVTGVRYSGPGRTKCLTLGRGRKHFVYREKKWIE